MASVPEEPQYRIVAERESHENNDPVFPDSFGQTCEHFGKGIARKLLFQDRIDHRLVLNFLPSTGKGLPWSVHGCGNDSPISHPDHLNGPVNMEHAIGGVRISNLVHREYCFSLAFHEPTSNL